MIRKQLIPKRLWVSTLFSNACEADSSGLPGSGPGRQRDLLKERTDPA